VRAREQESKHNYADALRSYVQAMHIRPGDVKLERKIGNLSKMVPASPSKPVTTSSHSTNFKPLQVLATPSHPSSKPQNTTTLAPKLIPTSIPAIQAPVQPKNSEYSKQVVRNKDQSDRIDKSCVDKNENRRTEAERTEERKEEKLEAGGDKGKKECTETTEENGGSTMAALPNGFFRDEDNDSYVLKSKDDDTELSVSSDLYNHLFDYQREGIKWMWGLYISGNGGILGDDMGLGKTMQVVGFLGSMIRSGHISRVLVVMPVSVLEHWRSELEKWGEGIRVKVFHGTSKKERETNLHRVKSRYSFLSSVFFQLTYPIEAEYY
jgi:hypothetical protein